MPETETPATPAPTAAPKITQNDVTRPKDGTTTGRVWAIADEISAKNGSPADRKSVIDQVVAEGINASTGATQYGKWRKFHGLVGDAAPGKAPKAETPAEAPAEGGETPPAPPAE
jgi:hypothetical protein